MNDFFKILPFQFNILLSSKLKVAVSLLSSIAIPIFFYASEVLRAMNNIDIYMTIPAIVLFSEIYNLEYYHETTEILYCKKKKKTLIIIQSFVIILISLILMSVIVFGIYILIHTDMLYDMKFNIQLILNFLYCIFCTFTFFGSLSMTTTNIFGSYSAGIGFSLFAFVLFYFVDFFNRNNIVSMFIFGRYDIWGWSKLFYLIVGIGLLIVNNFIVNSSPYSSVFYKFNINKLFRKIKSRKVK